MDDIYKSVLVENKTSDADITLSIYCSWDLVCSLPYNSKIIKPGEKYLYRSEDSFKFELRAHGEKSKRKVILSPALWDKDMLLHVTGSVSDIVIDEKELSEFPQGKQICLRRQNMEKEISADCGRNLYEILKLDNKEVREEKEIEKQKLIKREMTLVNKSVEIHEPKYKPSSDGFDCGKNREENDGDCSEHESNHGRIRLISEGTWKSKMILQYMGKKGKKEEKEVTGNSGAITIPKEARNIDVRFQVQRSIATWCDVKKYDRINKSWCKPITAHVFKYELPPIRTFTLAGSLYFEAVMHVRDEHWNDIVEMQ